MMNIKSAELCAIFCLHIVTNRIKPENSIVSLTSSLRSQLVKCFTTLNPNTLIFLADNMREVFAMQKLLTFFSTKNSGVFQILMFEI